MSYDAQDYRSDHPKYETTQRQPPLKELSVRGEFEDNQDTMIDFLVTGYYHSEEDNGIRIIDHKVVFQIGGTLILITPDIDAKSFYYWILAPAIQEELKISGHISFDQKLEI